MGPRTDAESKKLFITQKAVEKRAGAVVPPGASIFEVIKAWNPIDVVRMWAVAPPQADGVFTPLHTAAIRGDPNIAMFLAFKIDDLNDIRYSPLSDAASYENRHIASMPPDLGAYPEGAPAKPAQMHLS
jgi:hypothetical protein